ncbi:hypothetical protein [Pantoea cypripedii]|uniref:Uncharacterized protein n=1 Tax=Pantoea cypripedii TaxID=55209 RepID=A0A1X1EX29_PANCY|nr:hypothetical protein [Pantoea cypripedii]MBP2194650.1 hypothetical protein [Pantoea cypripedii]ORM94548.1 hypothetical protein HA50_14780 [Pantoea cypripedii]
MSGLKSNTASGRSAGLINNRAIKDTIFLLALLLVAIVVIVPLSPRMPWSGLDPSWMYGMNEATAQGMSFGKDIIFTFGPYSSIYTRSYDPATDQLMIWGSLFLAVSFAVAVWLNFRTAGRSLKIALLVALAALTYSRDALFFFYTMLVGIQVYHWAMAFDAKQATEPKGFALNAALFVPFGLLPLIKGSTLAACLGITFLAFALLAKRRQWKLCLLIGATILVSMVFFWALSGQPLTGLANYFIGLTPIVSGYTEAMAIDGPKREYIMYLVATVALVGCLLRDTRGSFYDKSVVAFVFLGILFLALKAGFVRHDSHANISGAMLLLGALLAGTLLSTRSAIPLLVVCLLVWGYIDFSYTKNPVGSIVTNAKNTFSGAWNGLKQRIFSPQALTDDFNDRINQLKKLGAIPKLEGTVDIYSYDQSYLLASGNKWNPRPVLQSYSVYTPKLAELNKMHLLGDNRPDNVIFGVQPIDRRLPSLEDGASWPVLLSSYEPTTFTGDYLYLKHRSTPTPSNEPLKPIGGGVYSFGEQITLPESDRPLFAKLDIRKSFAGSIMNTLFKPGQLEMKLTMQNGITRSYRIISGMTESGFIISPLIETTEEFGLLSADLNSLNDKRVKSIEISATSLPFLWKPSFNIEFYPLNYPSSRDFIGKMGFAEPLAKTFNTTTVVQQCNGSIDSANGVSPSSGAIKASSLLNSQGWLAASVSPAEVPDKVYLVLSGNEGKRYFFDTERKTRPDVGDYFKQPLLNSSGYETTADVSNLNGDYQLGLAYSRGNDLFVCPQFNVPVKISQE